MNQIKRKLHSKRGASLLIAMVYLIFAVFIGGSVLAAASANGYRIEHLSDQQDYLNQRSAALLLAEEMEFDIFANISLDARYATTTVRPVIIKPNGEIIDNPDEESEVVYGLSFKINYTGDMSAIHRVMFETAILRYMAENQEKISGLTPTFQNFVYDGETISTLSQFWTLDQENCSGNIQITGTRNSNNAVFTDYTARYRCGDADQLYDFIVDFGDFSQITVSMSGSSGTRPQRGTPEYEGSYIPAGSELEYSNEKITEVERTVISWSDPTIAKGGAAG